MITVKNYNEKKEAVNWKDQPSAVTDNRETVEDMLDLYGDDEAIDKMIDIYIKTINKNYSTKKEDPKPKAKKKPVSENKSKPKKEYPIERVQGGFQVPDKDEIKETITSVLLDSTMVRHFIPNNQRKAVTSDELIDVVKRLEKELNDIPTKEQKGSIMDQKVYAHYFNSGSDWYVTDISRGKDEPFGYAVLNGDLQMAEAGYLPLSEIKSSRSAELDFYFNTGKTLKQILKSKYPSEFEDDAPRNTKAAKKTVKKAVDVKFVDSYSEEFKLLRRFLNATKKEGLTFRQVQLLYMAFQKAAVGRSVRKASDKADEFTLANAGITKIYSQSETDNAKKNGIELDIENTKLIKDLTEYVSSTKINYAVTLLRSFIGMQGTKVQVEKAQRLLKKIQNGIDKGRVDKDNRLYDQVTAAAKELKEYIADPSEKMDAEMYGLSAPRSTCTNRIKCKGLHDNGRLKKGYRFLEGGAVVTTKKKKGLGEIDPKIYLNEYYDFPGGEIIIEEGDYLMVFFDGDDGVTASVDLDELQDKFGVKWSEDNVSWVRSLKGFRKMDKLFTFLGVEDPDNGLNAWIDEDWEQDQIAVATVATAQNEYSGNFAETEKTPTPVNTAVATATATARNGSQRLATATGNKSGKVVKRSGKGQSLTEAMSNTEKNEVFKIDGAIGKFLGQVEKKPVHSVVTTLDAKQGSGKTRFFFQIINALASTGAKCLFYSLEEHPQSKLFKDKIEQYIDPANYERITVIDEVEDWDDEKKVIEEHDMIFFDSFQKLPQIDLDNDIRKAFNGKWFFVIYQQTSGKSMRGGSKAAFDGDIILKVEKGSDYRDNEVYANKNRYNDAPELRYNIFSQSLIGDAVENDQNTKPAHTEFIATPML